MDFRKEFGNNGEELAATYLQNKGYNLLQKQWRCVFGEIDIVCEQDQTLVFVEVKSRRDDSYGYPEDSVTRTKRKHLAACAEEYLVEFHKGDVPWRVDVVAIEFDQTPPNIVHLEAIDM